MVVLYLQISIIKTANSIIIASNENNFFPELSLTVVYKRGIFLVVVRVIPLQLCQDFYWSSRIFSSF